MFATPFFSSWYGCEKRFNRPIRSIESLPLYLGFCSIRALFPGLSIFRHGWKTMKTYSAKPETVKREWYVLDASGKVLGRVATEIARRLRGKHKPEFTPHVDTGDYIIVINADKIQVTGKKERDKVYHSYSGYQSGLKSTSVREMRVKHPERLIEIAVKGMLPKNPLGRQMFGKLKVYRGAVHRHSAQQPKTLEIV
jgi:large subunit ribosomal protein L13